MENNESSLEQLSQEESLDKAITEAEAEITERMKNPAQDLVDRTNQLGFFAAVKEAADPHLNEMKSASFKDLKATFAAAIALIPFVGEARSASALVGTGKAMETAKEVYSTGKKGNILQKIGAPFKATGEFFKTIESQKVEANAIRASILKAGVEKALPKHAKIAEQGVKVADTLIDATLLNKAPSIVKKAKMAIGITSKLDPTGKIKEGVGKVMDFVNPTPDVPVIVDIASNGAEAIGIHGAGIIAPLWQMAVNRIVFVKHSFGLVKDVGAVVVERAKQKIQVLADEKESQAAGVFASVPLETQMV